MLQIMDSPEEFSLMVITANKQNDTGGERLLIKRAWGHRQKTHRETMAIENAQKETKVFKRNPNHYANSTRNIRLVNSDIITVHIRLIREFNNKTVL